jgi:hypothetical protein
LAADPAISGSVVGTPKSGGLAVIAALATLLAAAAAPHELAGQRAPTAGTNRGWPAVEIGARVGLGNVQQGEVVGAVLRIPVLRDGRVELFPNGDVTFQRGFKEYQLNLEAVYLLSGGNAGLYAGGGVGFRDTLTSSGTSVQRETLTTFSVVLGLKLTGLGRVHPLFEFRRVIVADLVVDPQVVSIGATLVLW